MSGHVILSGGQREKLSETLRTAFTPQRFAELLEYRLNKRLDDIAMGGDYREIMFKVVRESQREGWTTALLLAARETLPENQALFDLACDLGLGIDAPPRGELERMLAVAECFMDVASFMGRLAVLEGAVCRIEVGPEGRSGLGTGFRITADLAMTCGHVLDPVFTGEICPSDVVFRFGYRRSRDGRVLHEGTEYHLAADWLVDGSSPNSSTERGRRVDTDPTALLDYAVVRLARTHTRAVDGLLPQEDYQYPAINLPRRPVHPSRGRTICILQHPAGDPLKLAFGPVTGTSNDGARILHAVNTLPGSSGAPCFNGRLRLIGLHQSGHPDDANNAAVSITEIVQRLERVDANIFAKMSDPVKIV